MGVGQKHEWKIRSSIRNNIKIYHPIVDVIENENNAQIQSVIFKIDNYTEKSKNKSHYLKDPLVILLGLVWVGLV